MITASDRYGLTWTDGVTGDLRHQLVNRYFGVEVFHAW